jgi:glycosyltransferase involved in cell wall biosynthesis
MLSHSLGKSGDATPVGVTRILVDCSMIRLDGQRTGIPRVVLNYARHAAAYGKEIGISVVPFQLRRDRRLRVRALPGEKPAAVSTARGPRLVVIAAGKIRLELFRYFVRVAIALLALLAAVLPLRPLTKATRLWSLKLRALRSQARGNIERQEGDVAYVKPGAGDVVLCPGYWHDINPAVYESLREQGAEVIFVLHDITPVTHPACYNYPWRWRFEQALARSLDYVSHYYCVSNKTLTDVTEFAVQRGKAIRASVAYNGFEPLPESSPARSGAKYSALLARQPWLMVGTLEPKKGHRDALAAFEALWAGGYQRPLVIVGQRGWMFDDIVETIEASRWLRDRLFWFEKVGDEELATFYRQAHALLFASNAEGFGLPLLEAAHHALPILARDTPATREILGSQGTFFTGPDNLIGAILAMEDPANLNAARKELARFTWFDWRSVVESVVTDILRPLEQRRTGANLLDPRLKLPVRRAIGDNAVSRPPLDVAGRIMAEPGGHVAV